MMAGAIATGKCKLASSSTWVSSAAPMTGSMSSDYFQDSCKDDSNFFMETFVDLTGLCPAGDGIQSLAYENETYSNPKLDEAYAVTREAYRANVSALMCSKGYAGIYSIEHLQYRVLGNAVPTSRTKTTAWSSSRAAPQGSQNRSLATRIVISSTRHS